MSETYSIEVNTIKEGDYVMLHERPCKVVQKNTCSDGKHFYTTTKITGVDLFNKKMYNGLFFTSHIVYSPVITIDLLRLSGINTEGYLEFVNEKKDKLVGVKLLGDKFCEIKKSFEQGEIVDIEVLSTLGIKKVVSCKITKILII